MCKHLTTPPPCHPPTHVGSSNLHSTRQEAFPFIYVLQVVVVVSLFLILMPTIQYFTFPLTSALILVERSAALLHQELTAPPGEVPYRERSLRKGVIHGKHGHASFIPLQALHHSLFRVNLLDTFAWPGREGSTCIWTR